MLIRFMIKNALMCKDKNRSELEYFHAGDIVAAIYIFMFNKKKEIKCTGIH